MKKFLSCLMVLAVVLMAFVSGLAILPHSHGDDFNHSKHSTCPVHQIGSLSLDDVAPAISISFFLFLSTWILLFEQIFIDQSSRLVLSLRAPPLV